MTYIFVVKLIDVIYITMLQKNDIKMLELLCLTEIKILKEYLAAQEVCG